MENQSKFCPHCGTENKAEATFCANCGQSMTINQADNKEPETKEKRPVNKKMIGIIGAIVAVILIVGGIFAYINAQPKSILGSVKVNFSGYNSQGTASISGNYEKKEIEIIGKKVGMSSSEIKSLENGNLNANLPYLTKNSPSKLQKFAKYVEDTRINLSQSQNLSNGQKVTLKITTTLKDNPIKQETKKYTVKSLEKATTYTIETALKENPVTFTGFNHFGSVKFDDDEFTVNNDDSDSAPADLTNGERVTVQLSENYISGQKDNGKILSGSATKTLTVSGLTNSPKISNLNDLLTQEDTVVRADNESTTGDFGTTYTVTRLDSYFVGTNVSEWGDTSDDENGEFSVVTIYKVVSHFNDDTDTSNDTTGYDTYGYTGLTLTDGKVDVSRLTDDNKYEGGSSSSEQAAVDQLKSDYSSATKLD
ncbi:zinc-ribbon domain-containing protein [Lactococcus nasutitermitis]|uniref:Zinc-ribbon domain-containing protein n=1 Tax=Lactococcus nasutitermitis TaxID=1652957 RepID=A0ABV9JAR0_9LACT|nr:zinc ribbon domain-containing protein [Lactococcus nasutitermitis]